MQMLVAQKISKKRQQHLRAVRKRATDQGPPVVRLVLLDKCKQQE
ncbi:hypothetical protein BVRB_1g022830 [Beta vulgaris subsp. vulgaris]|uniref:Uncharacterized protein n=1 Tax=Beta vulgaris subsp. vulgaris TaxID=3555 RepID=A0A0J8BF52_BETVV|nr:hypothetical protein BVRB_1g022830 [Beta vulgaris subsp. vulgaris]